MNRTAVIKVGGSLFDWPELPRRLSGFLEERQSKGDRLAVLAGGGRAVDLVRELDRTFALGDVRAHRLAVQSLDLTAQILAAIVPTLVAVNELAGIENVWKWSGIPVLAPSRFLVADETQSADPLPCSWDVTSDAIAARLASRLGAAELVLLKSAPLSPGVGRREAARLGLVDPVFPEISRDLERVVYVNLREAPRVPVLLAP